MQYCRHQAKKSPGNIPIHCSKNLSFVLALAILCLLLNEESCNPFPKPQSTKKGFYAGTGRVSGGGRASLSTPSAVPSSALQPPAWRSKPPSPSDLSLGAPQRLDRKPQRPTEQPTPALLPPSIYPSVPPRPAVQRPRRTSKVGVKRPLKRAYADEGESDGAFEELGVVDLSGETENGVCPSAPEQPVNDDDEVSLIQAGDTLTEQLKARGADIS